LDKLFIDLDEIRASRLFFPERGKKKRLGKRDVLLRSACYHSTYLVMLPRLSCPANLCRRPTGTLEFLEPYETFSLLIP
jgi:hypothetical protein